MKSYKGYLFTIIQLIVFVLSLVTNWYLPLVIVLTSTILISLLDKLGKGIILREMIALHSSVICLAMPAIGFSMYTFDDMLSRKWVRFMPIEESVYFNYALPAITAFSIAICLPLNKKDYGDEGAFIRNLIQNIRNKLKTHNIHRRGVWLLVIGITAYFIAGFLPIAFKFISLLFFFSSFAGILYVFFSPKFAYKVPILVLFTLFILANAVESGMFTVVAYMGITIFSFLFVGKRISFWMKLGFFSLGVFILLLIQSVKPVYRDFTWNRDYEGNKTSLFIDLVSEQISKGEFFSKDAFFWIYYRANQGYNVALVMRRVPSVQPHDGGVNFLRSAAASVVPRVLWPDKPEAGGKFNMKFYADVDLKGWSTNIGPLGEAYGGFGVPGGIVFMACLGLFIRWAYTKVFFISRKIPLFICWLPVLFYQVTYSAETDTLQILNSLIKSAFFVWMLYKIYPKIFGEGKNERTRLSSNRFPHMARG